MPINIPTRQNNKLEKIVERINQDVELHQMWKCANVNAVDRSGINDHGEVHIRIVSNIALKLMRLLTDAGVQPSVVKNYGLTNGLTNDDAEVIVVLGACTHDLGIAIHRENHENYSPLLAAPKLRELLDGVYSVEERVILTSEVLHAIVAHHWDVSCLTIEAGVVKISDALDMTQGRSRIPFEAGKVNIHSVSAAAIESVTLKKGEVKPISIEVTMSNSAGIFQLDQLLKPKLRNSSIAEHVEIVAKIEAEVEKTLVKFYTL